jgi:hypothetical protein
MHKPGDEARMAKMRARRAPFTDARQQRMAAPDFRARASRRLDPDFS